MTFSIPNQAMLGLFPAGESPLTTMNKTFFDNIEKDVDGSCFQGKFQNTLNNLEKVHLFNKYFKFDDNAISNSLIYSKCPSTSTELRDRSNTYYRQKHFQRALRGYNLAILFAPGGTPEFSLALANRSAAFLELSYYDECLRDIEMALKNGYPEELKLKLEERRLKCSASKQKDQSVSEQNDFRKFREFRDNKLFKLNSPNPMMPSAEDFISISTHKDRGRELIITKEVPVGTVLIVENPFVKLLKNELTFDVEHCHNCLKNNLGGIPCSGCVFAIYCTEQCREEAWELYHKHECPCMTLLHLNKTPRYAQLAFRIICILGPEKTYELYKSRESSLFNVPEATLAGIDTETGIYSSSSYLPIYHLVSNSKLHSELENFSNTMQSLVLAHCLEKQTNFFEKCNEGERDEYRTWLGSLILHHFQNIPCNSISLDELKESNSDCSKLSNQASTLTPTELAEKMRILQFDQYASATYGLISLINHSCDPNVTRVNDSVHGRMAIVTLKGLKPGEALSTSYTKVFLNDVLDERRDYLESNYYFLCQCRACTQNWPALAQLSAQEPKFKCIPCSAFPNNEFMMDKKGYCSKCGTSVQSKKRLADYIKFVEKFYQSYQLVLQNKPVEAISNVVPCLEYFHSKLGSPYSKTYMAQDVMKRAFDMIVYFSN